jgi:hypothetical protein
MSCAAKIGWLVQLLTFINKYSLIATSQKGQPEMAKAYFTFRLEEDLIKRLNDNAVTFNRKNGQEVAAEIVDLYIEFWERAEEAKRAVLKQQRAGLFTDIEVSQPLMSGKGSKREIEKVKKDAQSRERTKRDR